MKSMVLKNDAFNESERQQNIFSLKLNGVNRNVVLARKNDYNSTSKIISNKITPDVPDNQNHLWFLSVIPIFILGYFTIKNLKINQSKIPKIADFL